jgi:non-ribosomal peptide synthetase component F/acyl carrier protein
VSPLLPIKKVCVLCKFIDLTTTDDLVKLPANTKNPERKVKPQHLAYILYNSDTTPKGVMVQHQAPVNMLYYLRNNYPLNTNDCIFQNISFSFDPSVMQIFWALMSGAKLVVSVPNGHKDVHYMVRTIQQHKVTILCFVPNMFGEFLTVPDITSYFESVKLIMFGGSALKQTLKTRILETFQGRDDLKLLNSYGPAEAGIVVSVLDIKSDYPIRSNVPIGKPIPNMGMLILDDHLGRVPLGTTGKLYIAGIGLARGYLNIPEENYRLFISNPHPVGVRDKILFKTGDLATVLLDGNIKFLGKEESLFKTSGYSIEMSDIEVVVGEHSHVRACYVTPDQQKKQLIAYIILDQVYNDEKQAFILSDLRGFLKSRLPAYMIPYYFLPLPSLPLTVNGKVDTKALPKPTLDTLIRQSSIESAVNEIEQMITDIWRVVLHLDAISLDSNFFQLGGDSISAVKLLRDISAKLEVPPIPLHEFYGEPTLAAVSVQVLKAKNTAKPPNAISSAPTSAPTPISYEQQRVFEFEKLTGPGYLNKAQVIRFTGNVNVKHLEEAIRATIRRHEALRSIVQQTNNSYQLEIQKPTVSFKIAVQKLNWGSSDIREGTAAWTALKSLVDKELLTPIPLDKAPLMRVTLFSTRKPLSSYLFKNELQQHVLVINIHQIAIDDWSTNIITKEIGANYKELVKSGKPAVLPALPVQYRDYTHWQRTLLPTLASGSRSYWKNKLSELPVLKLRVDHQRPTNPNYVAGVTRFVIPEQLVAKLRNILKQRGDTLFMGLFTTWTILLHQYSLQEDIIVGLETGGRIHPQEDLVGRFAHLLPIRVNFSGNPRFLNMIDSVKALCIEAFTNDIPLGLILQSISAPTDASRHPLFQTAVTYSSLQTDSFITHLSQFRSLPIHDLEEKHKDHNVTPLDIQINFIETHTEIDATILFNKVLFDTTTVQQFAEHMKVLLKNLSTAAHVSISNLPNPLAVDEQFKKPIIKQRRLSFSNTQNPLAVEEQFKYPRRVSISHVPNPLGIEEQFKKPTISNVPNQLAAEEQFNPRRVTN